VVRRLEEAGLSYWTTPSGLAHGTVTAMLAGRAVEVTTLRRDVATDGRHAQVAFTDDWLADASRRDFTINALSADPRTGRVHDPFGGLADLDAGWCASSAIRLRRIAEDHLRILRFFRFHARFGGETPDPALAVRLRRPRQRPDGAVARADRGRAAEAAGPARPQATMRLMVGHGVLAPGPAGDRLRRHGRARSADRAEAAAEGRPRCAAPPRGAAAGRSACRERWASG
jgi:poly(A) polymerase